MSELTQQLQKAIQEALPQMQADELKKFISNAQQEQAELKSAKEQLAASKKQIEELSQLKASKEYSEKTLSAAQQLNETANQKELHIQGQIDKITIATKDQVIQSYKEFLALLVKNPRAIELTQETKNIPVYVPYPGGGGHHETKFETNQITTESKETKDDSNY